MKCEKCGYELFPFDTKCEKCGAIVKQESEEPVTDSKKVVFAKDKKEKKSAVDSKIAADINTKKPIPLSDKKFDTADSKKSAAVDDKKSSAANGAAVAATVAAVNGKGAANGSRKAPGASKPAPSDKPPKDTKKIVLTIVAVTLVIIALGVIGIVFIKPLIQKKIEDSKHVHDYVDGVCIGCGEEDPDYVPHVHEYVPSVIEPTCTEGGYTNNTCSCGDSYVSDETEPKGHSYTPVVTEPTCTEGGYTTYTCDVCGDEYVDDVTEAFGHTYEDGVCIVCGEAEIPEEIPEENPEETTEETPEEVPEEVPEETPEPPADPAPNDTIPKTGESNAPILLIAFLVFSIIGIIYSLYVYAFPSEKE